MQDPDCRPPFVDDLESIDEYDTVFLGFPIWWYTAPRIVFTFLEQYDFSGKRIIMFATSGSSGFGKTIEDLIPSVSGDTIIDMGEVYHHSPSMETLEEWLSQYDEHEPESEPESSPSPKAL